MLSVLLCLVCRAAPLPAAVDSPPPLLPQVRAIRTTQPVTIDGRLEDPIWRTADQITGFLQRDPNEGTAPSESTVVLVAYDDAALYVAARLYDGHPDSIVARLSRRDQQSSSDYFSVYVDPYHDRRSGFYFGINAAGTLFDGTLLNDDWNDDTWDGVWEGKAGRDSLGWTAELRIPYSQLRFLKRPQQIWGINFRRDIARRNERDFLVYTPKNGSGFVSRFVDLVGVDEISPPPRLEIMPYATSRAELSPHAAGDPFNDGSRLSPAAGVDARIGLGSNLTLNATVNPDFGQVEVDPAVVNLSDVETFFSEKRPFFVEGSSTFSFGQGGQRNNWGFNWPGPTFFYSRRIGRSLSVSAPDGGYADGPGGAHILGAVKLTGKAGGSWNIGALSAVTNRERATLQDSLGARWNEEIEPLAFYGVYRAQKDIDQGRRGIGFMSTVAARAFRDPALRDARNAGSVFTGVDGWTFLDKNRAWVTTWRGGVSRISGTTARLLGVQQSSSHYFQQPDAGHVRVDSGATSMTGAMARVTLAKQKGNTFVNSALGFISPTFDLNDVGFLSRTGIVNMHLGAGYSWTKPGKVFRSAELLGAVFRNYDWDGNINWSGVFAEGSVQLKNFYWINWNAAYNPWTVNNRRTRGGPLTLNPPGTQFGINLNSDSRKAWTFGVGSGVYEARSDHNWWTWVELGWRPAPNLSLSVSPNYSTDVTPVQYVGTYDTSAAAAAATYGKAYVFARLRSAELSAGIRLNWTYTPTLSLQLYAQPLISAGKYDQFKWLARPRTFDFTPAGAPYNPDFNFRSLRGNAVLRWEYLPGSTLFFVWTQTRQDVEDVGDFAFQRSMDRLLSAKASNIFMIKATYWWNP
jgi:uncharacterized protein DUF5916